MSEVQRSARRHSGETKVPYSACAAPESSRRQQTPSMRHYRFERADRVLGGQRNPRRKKAPVIRDTFSFPDFDYVLLSELQQRCLQGGHHASKSELVRAGLKALIQMKPDDLLKVAKAVEKLKPGRVRESP